MSTNTTWGVTDHPALTTDEDISSATAAILPGAIECPTDPEMMARLYAISPYVGFSKFDIIKGAAHAHFFAQQVRATATENPSHVKGRVFRSVTIEGHTFKGRIEDDGNVFLDKMIKPLVVKRCSARLGMSSIRQYPTSEIDDILGGASYGLDLEQLRSSSNVSWWVCHYDDYIKPRIPLTSLSPAGVFALALEFGLPIVPLAENSVPRWQHWNSETLDFTLPVPDPISMQISPEMLRYFKGVTDRPPFYTSPAFDSLCTWGLRYPKLISSRKAKLSQLGDWIAAAKFTNSERELISQTSNELVTKEEVR